MKIRWEKIFTLAVFALIITLLVIIEARPNFPDPDSFYHAKLAVTIRDQGFIQTFPWFQWTSLQDSFVDSHLFYHLLLVPFVTFFDPLIGMKVSAFVFGLLAFFAIYRFLRYLKVPWPALIVLVTALSQGFLLRMSLPRAPALSVAILLLGTWAIIERRKTILFFTSLFFTWLYYGWPVIYLSLAAILLAQIVTETLNQKIGLKKVLKQTWQTNYQTIGFLIFGTIAGLIINPYFPNNIFYSFFSIIKIGLINYQSILPVGREWFPTLPHDLILAALPLLIVFIFSFALFLPGLLVSKYAEDKKYIYQLFLSIFLAGGYTLLTLKSNRYVEYLVPFLALATGLLVKNIAPFLKKELWPIFIKSRLAKISFTILLLLSTFSFSAMGLKYVTGENDYYQVAQYSTATDWLKEHVPTKEVIFHNTWDYSCALWYLDDTHYYLVGLDPTLMYDFDPAATDLYLKLSDGRDPDVSQIKTFFKARVVIVDLRMAQAEDLINNLIQSGLFEEVARNQWLKVFATPELAQSNL